MTEEQNTGGWRSVSVENVDNVDFAGLPVVFRSGILEFPEEYAFQVMSRLAAAGISVEELAEPSGPMPRVPGSRSRRAEAEGLVQSESSVEVQDFLGVVDEVVSPRETVVVPEEAEEATTRKTAQLRDIERLEEEAFNLMAHREKVLSRVKPSDEQVLASMLTTGLDQRVQHFREEVSKSRRMLDEIFKSFLETVSSVKAAEFFRESYHEMLAKLEHPDAGVKTRLSEICGRLSAMGGTFSEKQVGAAIAAKMRTFDSKLPTQAAADRALRDVLEAETSLEVSLESLKSASLARERLKDTARKQLEDMASLSFVEEVHCVTGQIRVDTAPAKVRYRWGDGREGKERVLEIGEFRIVLNLDGGGAAVALLNKRYGGRSHYQHPHVSGSTETGQSICWGNIRDSVYKLLKEWDFATLLTLLWNFINSYNSGDSYAKMFQLWQDWGQGKLPEPELLVRER